MPNREALQQQWKLPCLCRTSARRHLIHLALAFSSCPCCTLFKQILNFLDGKVARPAKSIPRQVMHLHQRLDRKHQCQQAANLALVGIHCNSDLKINKADIQSSVNDSKLPITKRCRKMLARSASSFRVPVSLCKSLKHCGWQQKHRKERRNKASCSFSLFFFRLLPAKPQKESQSVDLIRCHSHNHDIGNGKRFRQNSRRRQDGEESDRP